MNEVAIDNADKPPSLCEGARAVAHIENVLAGMMAGTLTLDLSAFPWALAAIKKMVDDAERERKESVLTHGNDMLAFNDAINTANDLRKELAAKLMEVAGVNVDRNAWRRAAHEAMTERDAARAKLAAALNDTADAAGELLVPIPEPGTMVAKLLAANAIMRRERDDARATAREKARDEAAAVTRCENAERRLAQSVEQGLADRDAVVRLVGERDKARDMLRSVTMHHDAAVNACNSETKRADELKRVLDETRAMLDAAHKRINDELCMGGEWIAAGVHRAKVKELKREVEQLKAERNGIHVRVLRAIRGDDRKEPVPVPT